MTKLCIMINTRPIVILFGPTGVGKSDLAEKLAATIPSEIINMDVGQLYTPLSIGTAKPDWRSSSIPHHLFDCIDTPRNYTVTEYRSQVITLASDILQRNKLPLLVGGSAFYLKSLLFPPQAPSDSKTTIAIHKDSSWQELYDIDPVRAQAINKQDFYRIRRALEVWRTTGRKPSEYTLPYQPPYKFLLIYVTRDRQELYTKINSRVRAMIYSGWLEEVQKLRNTEWESFLYEKKIIGYNEILTYLAGEQSHQGLEDLISAIAQRTRHYAKRQNTFWNMLERQIQQAFITHPSSGALDLINLTSLDVDLYIKQLSKRVLGA